MPLQVTPFESSPAIKTPSTSSSQADTVSTLPVQSRQVKEELSMLSTPPVAWTDEDDPANPANFSQCKKVWILFVLCTSCLCVLCSSSVISTCFTGIERDLDASPEVAILSISLFVLGLALAPPIVAPLSEVVGRRPVYLFSLAAFFLLGFPVAFANNLAVLFIFRFLTGVSGASFTSVIGGTVNDLWKPSQTYLPMAFFTASTFMGPVVGPVYGSFVDQFSSNWRWSLWAIQIWAFVQLVSLALFCPETFTPALLKAKAKAQAKDVEKVAPLPGTRNMTATSLFASMRQNLTRIPILLIYEPMLTLLCLWTAVLLGIVYAFFEMFPIVFAAKGLSIYQIGLTFLGLAVGVLVALASMPLWKRRYLASMESKGGVPAPEDILEPSRLGSILSPLGLFIFAFTSYDHVPWIGAVVGASVFGAGAYYTFFSVFIYSVQAWRPVAASALGANAIMRCSFAAGFPLFADQMIHRLTGPGAVGLLAGLNCLLIPVPFLLFKYGEQIRSKSRFAL